MPIKVFNRYTNSIELENVSHEKWIDWLYNSNLGRAALNVFVKRAIFSKIVGWRMNTAASKKLIEPFAAKFNINLEDFLKASHEYDSFNDFFTRKFKPGKRDFDQNSYAVAFPADGRHSVIGCISAENEISIKGSAINVKQLLSGEYVNYFENGIAIVTRLCPADYHRFHFPVDCNPSIPKLINGALYSVSPIALAKNFKIFTENKRVVTILESEIFGKIAMVEVGATCVGSVIQTFKYGESAKKGDEKGFFSFGGSTIITIFQKNKVSIASDLINCSNEGIELFAKCGDVCATKNIL